VVLTSLDLYRNNFGPEGGKALAEALRVNTVLTTLDLSQNRIGPVGAKALAEALRVNAMLTNLSVAFNSSISGEAAQQLATAALSTKSLKVLSEVPIQELREDKHTSLNLSSKGLGPAEGIVLAKLMKFSAVLTDLNIAVNNIGPGGAKAFADALRINAVLTSFDLSGNCLCGLDEDGDGTYDASGIKALASALEVNTVLTSLNLHE
jgi:Ran GTPase-activating protein (RanGAP) involved in mRNA processing and transport